MPTFCPADELLELRAEIARLRAREDHLTAAFLRAPETAAIGRWARADVIEEHVAQFDPALLPTDIRHNVKFIRDAVVRKVVCVPLTSIPAHRPGWPIRREAVVVALH